MLRPLLLTLVFAASTNAESLRVLSWNIESGGADRLAIIIDGKKYQIRLFSELFSFGDYQLNDWRHRPPLVAHLRQKASSQELLLVTVHLARGNADLRTEQAAGLRDWARTHGMRLMILRSFRPQRTTKWGNRKAPHLFCYNTRTHAV